MPSKVSSVSQYHIPDTLRNWPWSRHLSPHYPQCKSESEGWCESFKAFSPKAQKAFNRCDFSLLASLAYPKHTKAGVRIGCDLMNLFFVIDGYTDAGDGKSARLQADIVMDALRNPLFPRPKDEWVGGEVTRTFWANAIKHATPTSQRRFVDTFQLYIDAVVQQAEDRTNHHIRSIREYFPVRRDTVGTKPSFAVLECELDLPEEVHNHPIIARMTTACTDMIILGNDLWSYNVEQACGDDEHNIVTIAMHELKTDFQGALDWITRLHDQLAESFLQDLKRLPKWGEPLDSQVATYVDGLANWVRANEVWSFESERYFGKKGLEIQKSLVVDMLPKQYVEPKSKPTGRESTAKEIMVNPAEAFISMRE